MLQKCVHWGFGYQPLHEALEDAQVAQGESESNEDDGGNGDVVEPGNDSDESSDHDGGDDVVPPSPVEEIQPEPPDQNGEPPRTKSNSNSSSSDSSDSSSSSSSSTSTKSSSSSSNGADDNARGSRRAGLEWPNHMWGEVRFTHKVVGSQRVRPQWQVTCPYCLSVGSTRCTPILVLEAEDNAVDTPEDLKCRRRLKFWAVQGQRFHSKEQHQQWQRSWRKHMAVIDAMIPDDDGLVVLRDSRE